MPYVCIKHTSIAEMQKNLNELAEKYKSFRLISTFSDTYKVFIVWCVVWFNEKDYTAWLDARLKQ